MTQTQPKEQSVISITPPPLRLLYVVFATMLFVLLAPTMAVADSGAPPAGETVLGMPIWPVVVGGIGIIGSYLLNHFAFWGSEPAKAVFLLAYTTVAGALTQLVDAGTVSFDADTLKYVVAAVAGALLTHFGLWRPNGVNVAFGAGRNSNGKPVTANVGLGKQ